MIDGSIYVSAFGAGLSRLDNSGVIPSQSEAIIHEGTEFYILTNSGTTRGGGYLLYGNSPMIISNETTRIFGEMYGNILFAAGIDTCDGRRGFVLGTVYGGEGNDIFISGSEGDRFVGGLGSDLLDIRSSAGVQVYLDGTGPNTRVAAGDIYTSIEIIFGSTTGADRLFGSALANVLRGIGGNDSLSGGAGGDILVGGVGGDVLTGGLGNDFFQFLRCPKRVTTLPTSAISS